MTEFENFSLFLPKYLSPDTENRLLADLKEFPGNIDQKFYGFYGKLDAVVYQGDALTGLPYINFPDPRIEPLTCVVLSNTCDVEPSNQRKYSSSIVYSPVINIAKYKKLLIDKEIYSPSVLEAHLGAIRRQEITQIFYLPSYSDMPESIVFLDRLCHCDSNFVLRDDVSSRRLFSLSQYGFYLFLYKLSIHFTRFHESVDRAY